jgi:ribonucleotide reductase alpha subunit
MEIINNIDDINWMGMSLKQKPFSENSSYKMNRFFTKEGKGPFLFDFNGNPINWIEEDVSVTNDSGKVVFTQPKVKRPDFWSSLAIKVVASKYFWGDMAKGERENSVEKIVSRVARFFARQSLKQGYFNEKEAEIFRDELASICLNQLGAFNSPVWFNAGIQEYDSNAGGISAWKYDLVQKKIVHASRGDDRPQCSACFIQSVEDDMDAIMALQASEANLFKAGSGTGSNRSNLRSSREKLTGGGRASGPVSFIKGYDAYAGIIKSGGKTRRAAKMEILNVDHPDIVDFIEAKQKEEKKAWALMEQGYSGGMNGEAYGSISFQNCNLSVRVSDSFMDAVKKDEEWATRFVKNREICETYKAKEIMKKISEGTWICGDPGMQFDTMFNKWHTCKNSGRINATNPCFVGNTLVALADGRNVSFEQLVKEASEGKQNHCYTIDKMGCISIGKIINPRVTRKNAEVMRVVLDNSEEILCTPDHKFMLKSGQFKKAKDLLENESLMPLYEKQISIMPRNNHKVKKVEGVFERYDVYDFEVPDTHNFALSAGVFVHNCSEYAFLDDSACNLASINLMKFRTENGLFNSDAYKKVVKYFITAQELAVDGSSYPTDKICKNSHDFRPLGLGYANLGALLMSLGLPYDSDSGRAVAAALTAIMTGEAYKVSAQMASLVGPFPRYAENKEPMLEVIKMHREAVKKIDVLKMPETLRYLVNEAWDSWTEALELGEKYGYRNAQVTVLAPTGTIAFLMDCDTTGIEPDIALVKYKVLAGGGMLKLVNRSVALALRNLGYSEQDIVKIIEYVDKNDTIEGSPIRDEHLPVFDCAFRAAKGKRFIQYKAHIQMMAATQPFLSGSISKTINMPEQATIDEISDAYVYSWEQGLKAVAIYRENSKRAQPLNTQKTENEVVKKQKEIVKTLGEKVRMPQTRKSITHKFDIAGHEGYITVGLYDDGKPGELFMTMHKQGSTIRGLIDAWATSVSLNLQYGAKVSDLFSKFRHQKFEPSGFVKNTGGGAIDKEISKITSASSIIDYVAQFMLNNFGEGAGVIEIKVPELEPVKEEQKSITDFGNEGLTCPHCGGPAKRLGNCAMVCTSCKQTTRHGCGE